MTVLRYLMVTPAEDIVFQYSIIDLEVLNPIDAIKE